MRQPEHLLKTVSPGTECPISETRPEFYWEIERGREGKRITQYGIRLVPLLVGQDARAALNQNRPVLNTKGILTTSLAYPEMARSLRAGRAYAYQITAYQKNGAAAGTSDIGMFYVEKRGLPFRLADLFCCDGDLLKTEIHHWRKAYGTPTINRSSLNCLDQPGLIEMEGFHQGGDAVYQRLEEPLSAGKRYTLHFCARLIPKQNDHIRFRLIAFNGSLSSVNGQHPAPSEDIQIIAVTGRITSHDWTRVMLLPWQAPRDFSSIAVLAFTNDKIAAFGEVAAFCLTEHAGSACGAVVDAQVADDGTVTLPAELRKYVHPDHEPQAEMVQTNLGRVVDIYGDMFDPDGKLAWYPEDPCVSVGGKVPPEIQDMAENKHNPVDLGGGVTQDDFDTAIGKIFDAVGKVLDLDKFEPIEAVKKQECRPFKPVKGKPFGGRDIIYVHGFRPCQVTDNIQFEYEMEGSGSSSIDPRVHGRWPEIDLANDGYYSAKAEAYWDSHINQHLVEIVEVDGEEKEILTNRYLIISFNCNQPLIANVHAMLTQIRNAMSDGTGVVHDPEDSRGAACFGRSSVIVSHSTGSLLTNVALALAARAGADAWIGAFLGDVREVAAHVDSHIALHGAITGSELASTAVVAANIFAASIGLSWPAPTIDVGILVDTNTALNWLESALNSFIPGSCPSSLAMIAAEASLSGNVDLFAWKIVETVNRSILVDLAPIFARNVWGSFFNEFPVPVLTVVGGHPSVLPKPLRSLDDGIVNADSQSGSESWPASDTYDYLTPMDRIYDMGISPLRARIYYIEQYEGEKTFLQTYRAAYGASPYLSPSGMRQPVLGGVQLNDRLYDNHYTFLESASDHNDPIQQVATAYDSTDPTFESDFLGQFFNEEHNYEETLAVTNPGVFFDQNLVDTADFLVNPAITNFVFRCERRAVLSLPISIFIPQFTLFPPSVSFTTVTITISITIWRRIYDHLKRSSSCYPWPASQDDLLGYLNNFEAWQECDYVYRYVLR